MNEIPPQLDIGTTSRRNGVTLTLLGIFGVSIGLVLFILRQPGLFAVALLCFSLGAVALLLGLAKRMEPAVMLQLTPEGVTFFHRRGQLQLTWDNIMRMDLVKVQRGLEWITLPYLGLRLRAINPLLDNISPRLASGLLTEQRPLMMTALANDEDLQQLEHFLAAEFTPLLVNGDRYRGLLAMFGHRCQTLEQHLGFHLYLPTEFLPMEPQQLMRLLRDFQQQQLKCH